MAKFATHASGAIWWPYLQLMQVAQSGGQICNWCKCRHLAYLIFVTDVTDGVCGEKLFMWRNSPHDMLSSGKFLHMINVGKLCHMGKFLHITNVGKICQVENFSTWERWRKSVMWRNFSSWEMWRKYVKSALSNCLKMALYHQGQQIRLLSNQGAQGGTAQPTFLLLNLSVISFSITI